MDYKYMPYYMTYPMTDVMSQNNEDRRDVDYIKSLYPKTVTRIQELIDEECDKMEYDGSVMYDEYPDRLMLKKLCNNIYNDVKYMYEENEEFTAVELGRPCLNCGWVNDFIEIMLYNELYKRRCRRRNCRRWYW